MTGTSTREIQVYLENSSRLILASLSIALKVPRSSSACRGTVMNETSLVSVTWLPLCLRTLNPNRLVSILIRSFPEIAGSLLNLSLCSNQLSFLYGYLPMLHSVVSHGFQMRLNSFS